MGGDCTDNQTGSGSRLLSRKPRGAFRTASFVLALVGALILWSFREPLRNRFAEKVTLANDAPPPQIVEEMIQNAADPRAALLAAWNSEKIIHREVAIRTFGRVFSRDQPLPPQFNSLLISAALDADMDVRESALGILEERNHPALPALAAEQLRDCDQEVRALGLNHLRSVSPRVGVPTVIPLLDDSDPFIVTLSLKLLERWSGEHFGVKLSETTSFEDERTGLRDYRPGGAEKAKAGANRAKAWWTQHQGEFPPVRLQVPRDAYSARQPIPAGDFQLPKLDGGKVRLSDFRGKVVLLNFWTTWCTACVSEMPELIALQKKHLDKLVIIGVSLDYVPDEHGHIGGHAAVEEQGQSDRDLNDHEITVAALKRVRDKVARTVKARGINYPIVLDEHNEAGGRFNGGELPTTVIVDAQGNVRRRFIGARGLPVFEAMIAEASQGAPPPQTAGGAGSR
jgi:thiol-disulfide isomerase/thioredoxin